MGKGETENKQLILELVKENKASTISELSKKTNLSRPTIYLHLETLEKEGFISRQQDIEKKGKPVKIIYIEKEIEDSRKNALINFLEFINQNDGITQKELVGIDFDSLAHSHALFSGLIDKKIFLTEEGKKFLEEHRKKNK